MKTYQDEKMIQKLMETYMDAVYRADVKTLQTIFHERAAMYGYLGEDYVLGTPDIFYADLNSKPSMQESDIQCTYVIASLYVEGNMGEVCLHVSNFYGMCDVVDCFHLLKISGEWKIVCKTFTTA